ncbi:MAG: phage/plasmid replication protein [Pseudomonadota bacterium]
MLKVSQDFGFELPLLSDVCSARFNSITGETINVTQEPIKHEGSHCSSFNIRISGSRLTVRGNPSKWNRLDNVDGVKTLNKAMDIINAILIKLGLPPFTKCSRLFHRQGKQNKRVETFSDGAKIQEIHLNENYSTSGHSRQLIRAVSTIRYKNSIPRLHTNGMGTDWLSKLGKARLMYPKVYDKANELVLHQQPKIKRKYGKESEEAKYIEKLIDYLRTNGVVRFELELHSEYLNRHRLSHWGLFDESLLLNTLDDFTCIVEKKEVPIMEIQDIAEQLLNKGYVKSVQAANATAGYAMLWMNGKQFDLTKSQVQTHRARLRKIGIDIADEYDVYRHSPVSIHRAGTINLSPLILPNWYQEAHA